MAIQPETVKELWRGHNISMGVADRRNFYVAEIGIIEEGDRAGQEVFTKESFFSFPEPMIRHLIDRVGKRDAKNLGEYFSILQSLWAEIHSLCHDMTLK